MVLLVSRSPGPKQQKKGFRMIRSLRSWLRPWSHALVPGARDRVLALLRCDLRGLDSVLDVGCGEHSCLEFVDGIALKVGVEAFGPAIASSRARGVHHVYLHAELEHLDLGGLRFEAVIAIDLIEHFTKEVSRRLVLRLESLATRKVLLFTPNGFLPQPAFDGNPWQEHKYGWEAAELQELGYRVEGALGWKRLRGTGHDPKVRPRPLGDALAAVSRLVTHRQPRWDAALWAVKELA